MSPLVLYFASGESLYGGALLLLLAIVVSPFLKTGWQRLLRNLVAWLGLALMLMASPPISWEVYAGFLVAFTLWFISESRFTNSPFWARLRLPAAAVFAGFLAIVPAMELRHRHLPVITGRSSAHLTVIGDSISAGIDPRVPSWPTVMQQMTGVPVKSLALPGAELAEALTMAAKLRREDRVVLIEIGGNDLLSGVSSEEFAKRLEALLVKATSPGRVLVSFELPLLPLWVSQGRAQRRLAAKYGVYLIPKRYLAEVISGRNATLDGLHLSNVGTRRMSETVAKALSNVLRGSRSTLEGKVADR
jgi:acyl-CoA thioesterase I